MTRAVVVVAKDELRHQVRRPMYAVFLLLLGLASLGMSTGSLKVSSGDTSVGGKVAWVTSEVMVAYLLGVSLLLYLFFATLAAGSALMRDEESGTIALIRATALGPDAYLLGKLVGSVGAYLAATLLQVAALVVLNHGFHDPASHPWIGPFVAKSYVAPWLLVMLPTVVAFVVVGTLLAAATRRTLAIYLVPVVTLVVCAFFVWSFRPSWLPAPVDRGLMIVDPFAMRWLQVTLLDADRGVDFYNHAAVPWDATFVANRALLLTLTLVGLGFARRALRRTFRGAVSGRSRRKAPASQASGHGGPLAELRQSQRTPTVLRGIFTVAKFELRTLGRRPGIYIAAPLMMAQIAGGVWGVEGVFGTEVIATAGTLAVQSANVLSTVVCLVAMFYLVESLHRERALRLDGIYFAAPVTGGAIIGGKVLANVVVCMGIVGTSIVAGTAALAVAGRARVELLPFVLVWVVLLGPTFFAWNAFIAASYSVSGSRYLSYGAGLSVIALTVYGSVTKELTYVNNWALWGTLHWSDISVLELDRPALIANRLFVVLAGAFLVQLAVMFFTRRSRDRLQPSSLRPGRLVPLFLAASAALFASHHEVQAGPDGDHAKHAREDYWRAHHDTWLGARVPGLTRVELHLDIEPSAGSFSVDGSYEVVNDHDEPLERFAVTVGENFEDLRWTLNGEPFEPEQRAGLAVVEHALGPGAGLRLGFSHHGRYPAGSNQHGMTQKQFILPSAVVFNSFEPTVLPVIGYVGDIGVNKDNRTEPKRFFPGYHEAQLGPYLGSATLFTTQIEITGPADFTFNAVGERTDDIVDGDRRTVTWTSVVPVRFFNVIGARYEVKRGEGVAVFYDRRHPYNVDTMVDALEGARRHYGAWFGAYPYGELKLSEFPALATYAQGFPSNITFSEGIGFLAAGQLNAAFTITAHEAAHQWWANRLTPGRGPGASVLAESLSHFSTLLLLEEMKGGESRQAFAEMLERRYLENRRRDGERPLVEVDGAREGDITLVYEKGGFVFWMLMSQLGREPLLRGLAAMIERFGDGPDFPAVPDLLAELRGFATNPTAFDAMTRQLFEEVVLPEFGVRDARIENTATGARVRAQVANRGSGRFDVMVAALGDDGARQAVTLALAPGEDHEVVIDCAFQPQQIVVDPDVHILQQGRSAARLNL